MCNPTWPFKLGGGPEGLLAGAGGEGGVPGGVGGGEPSATQLGRPDI